MSSRSRAVKADRVAPLTRNIARFIRGLKHRDIPVRVLEPLKHSVSDSIGCGLLGSASDFGKLIAEFVNDLQCRGEATIWGTTRRAGPAFAAMANSAAVHAWDFDDTIMPAVLHPGSVAVPTAFAVAERLRGGTSGKDLLTAMAAGYEVGNVIGTALGSKSFASSGFYNSVPTIFVATATAAKLVNLSEEQTARALGFAATQAAGLYSATLGKRFNAPKAVLGGIFAVDLAQRGLEMSTDSIEASYSGFLNTFSAKPAPDVIRRDLGRFRFEIYHKMYPCIRSNQPTMESVRQILAENPDIRTRQIARIISHVDQLTVDYTVKTTSGGATGVNTVGNALVSLPYCVAATAVDGEFTFRQLKSAKFRNAAIKDLMKKIELKAAPAIDALPATHRYRCRVEIHLQDGRVIERSLVRLKGDPTNRLTEDERLEKFLSNASRVMEQRTARRLFDRLEAIDSQKDIRSIVRMLRAKR